MKTIKLNDDQYKLLLESLQNYDDCGSYKSNRLKELVAVISAADFDEGGIVPQGQICNLDGKDEIVLPLDPKVAKIAAKIIREAIEKCKLSQPKSPWIPVAERLPEPYKKVLMWSTISIEPDYGCLMGDEWATFETHGMLFGKDRKGKITHWMPLPPLPE